DVLPGALIALQPDRGDGDSTVIIEVDLAEVVWLRGAQVRAGRPAVHSPLDPRDRLGALASVVWRQLIHLQAPPPGARAALPRRCCWIRLDGSARCRPEDP